MLTQNRSLLHTLAWNFNQLFGNSFFAITTTLEIVKTSFSQPSIYFNEMQRSRWLPLLNGLREISQIPLRNHL